MDTSPPSTTQRSGQLGYRDADTVRRKVECDNSVVQLCSYVHPFSSHYSVGNNAIQVLNGHTKSQFETHFQCCTCTQKSDIMIILLCEIT